MRIQNKLSGSGLANEALLDETQAAQYLNVEARTLAVWRSTGRYDLPFVKIGRCVRYKKSDLDTWIEKRTHGNSNVDDCD